MGQIWTPNIKYLSELHMRRLFRNGCIRKFGAIRCADEESLPED